MVKLSLEYVLQQQITPPEKNYWRWLSLALKVGVCWAAITLPLCFTHSFNPKMSVLIGSPGILIGALWEKRFPAQAKKDLDQLSRVSSPYQEFLQALVSLNHQEEKHRKNQRSY